MGRRAMIAALSRRCRQPVQRIIVGVSQSFALRFHPPLEVPNVADKEAVEERPSVRSRCALILSATQCVFEPLNVAR